jgi:hypothetical protein
MLGRLRSAATRHSEVLALEGESICDRMERAAEIQ